MSPGKFGIAAFSPPLDAAGNSVRAQRAIRAISNELGGNPYDTKPASPLLTGTAGTAAAMGSDPATDARSGPHLQTETTGMPG